MQAWLESLPLGAAILFFWAGAVVRTTTIFALGRAAATGGSRRSDRVRELMDTAMLYRTDSGTSFTVYLTEFAGQSGHTIAQWHVDDLEAELTRRCLGALHGSLVT